MPQAISGDDAQYAYDIVRTICAEVGPGLPASPQELKRAFIVKRELETHLGAGNVVVEEFSLAPGAFLSAYPMTALLMLIAALLNISVGRLPGVSPWLTAVAALAVSILSPLPFIFQFVFNYELVDPLLKKKQSQNVVGTLRQPGTGEVKRVLILSGHHDSAPANTWFGLVGGVVRRLVRRYHPDRAQKDTWCRRLGYVFYFIMTTWIIGLIVIMATSLIQLAGLILGEPAVVRLGTLGWVLLAYPVVPAIVVPMFFTHGRKNGGIVPGAADNLSASALAVAACRFLVQNQSYIPAGTEIRFISFGSEEAGLRGSRRYVARHLEELKRLDARLLNFETVVRPEMVILTGEANGTVKVSPEIVKSLVGAAERAGVPYKLQAPWLGAGGDAAPFSRAGLLATTLAPFRMPEDMVDFYHQKWDQPEVLTIEPLQNALKLAVEWIRCGGE